MKSIVLSLLAGCTLSLFVGCASTDKASSSKSDWITLFDGSSTDAFRAYKKDSFPTQNWKMENGTLKTIPGNGTDLITKESFGDFELTLDWKISPGGNSGIVYRVSEDGERSWNTGPEMQVLDDSKHNDGKNVKTSAGALYALIAPTHKKLNPVGEWNHVRLLIKNNHVEHWLNGVKVVEYQWGSPELAKLIADSKFKSLPRFAKNDVGHIVLQHHHDEVWYRNIKIRRL